MLTPEERAKSTLRAIIRFAKARDRWPSLPELRTSNRTLGAPATVHGTLRFLSERGLVELRGKSQSARWTVTEHGFDLLRKPFFVPALERQRTHTDAAALLTPAGVRTNPNRAVFRHFASFQHLANDLGIAE